MRDKIIQSKSYLKSFDSLIEWDKVLVYLSKTEKVKINDLIESLAFQKSNTLQGFIFYPNVSAQEQKEVWMRWASHRVLRLVKKWAKEGKAFIGTLPEQGHPYLIYLPSR